MNAERLAELETYAVHEAGHAVVAALAGFPISYVTIRAKWPAGGKIQYRNRRSAPYTRPNLMRVACAGAIAEDLAAINHRADVMDGALTDLQHLRDMARKEWHQGHQPGHTVVDVARDAWAQAFDLVMGNAGAVAAVTQALLASPRALTGAQIRDLVPNAPDLTPDAVPDDARDFWPISYSRLRWTPGRPPKRRPA